MIMFVTRFINLYIYSILWNVYFYVCFVDRCLPFCTFWPLCCLFFFDLRILITPLVSSNSFCYIFHIGFVFLYTPPPPGNPGYRSKPQLLYCESTTRQNEATSILQGNHQGYLNLIFCNILIIFFSILQVCLLTLFFHLPRVLQVWYYFIGVLPIQQTDSQTSNGCIVVTARQSY